MKIKGEYVTGNLMKRRKNWELEYIHPVTKERRRPSMRTSDKAEAARRAHEHIINVERGKSTPQKITFDDFCERYLDEKIQWQSESQLGNVTGLFNKIRKHINPKYLAALNQEQVAKFRGALFREETPTSKRRRREARDAGLPEPKPKTMRPNSVDRYMRDLKAALKWAVEQNLLRECPKITKVPGAGDCKEFKGRPITPEEFERILGKVESVVGPDRARHWRLFVTGLFLSGLRRTELLDLRWEDPGQISIYLDEELIDIPADKQKRRKQDTLSTIPEFIEFLKAAFPNPEDRVGKVFCPIDARLTRAVGRSQVGRILKRIGEESRVKVWADDDDGEVKFATAHDYRRGWIEGLINRGESMRDVQQLARHRDPQTTLRHYAGKDARDLNVRLRLRAAKQSKESKPFATCEGYAPLLLEDVEQSVEK